MVLCDYEAAHFVKKIAMKLPKWTLKLFCKRKALKLRWYLFGWGCLRKEPKYGNLDKDTVKASSVVQVIA